MEIDFDTSHERVERAIDQLAALMAAVGWHDRASDPSRLLEAVRGSLWVVTAWEGTKLVGFCRAFSDGAFTAYVNNVAVLPSHQRRGIGKEMIRRIMQDRDRIAFVLHADPPKQDFYRKLGFEDAPDMLRRPRAY